MDFTSVDAVAPASKELKAYLTPANSIVFNDKAYLLRVIHCLIVPFDCVPGMFSYLAAHSGTALASVWAVGHHHRHTGWLGGSCLWVAWHRSAPGSSGAGSLGFSPKNTTLDYRTEKVAAKIYIHVFCMYTISVYRFNTSQGDVEASGCSVYFFLDLYYFAKPVSPYSVRHGLSFNVTPPRPAVCYI